MKTATTLEFRSAVRSAIALLRGQITGSWTEMPVRKRSSKTRYVGFRIDANGLPIHSVVEVLLNQKGLTANTRMGKTNINYVRGTCRI